MSTVTTDRKAPFLSRAGRWVAELVLIFVGVYGAFWLSNYQQHRQDAERRDRILASIEQTLRQGIESGKINRANEEREAAEFRRALDAGEMPSLHPFVFITDYSPGDFATMLQAGGIQLLDLQAEEDFAGVVHVHVVIHRHEVFGKHHLAHAPDAVRFSKATAPAKSGGKGMSWIAH